MPRRAFDRRVALRSCVLAAALIVLARGPSLAQDARPKVDILTHRYDNQRTGTNTREPVLNRANVAAADRHFGKLYEIAADGQVYAQPLLVSNVAMADGGTKDLLVLATMNNTVAAYSVDSGLPDAPAFPPEKVWSVSLGPPVPADFMRHVAAPSVAPQSPAEASSNFNINSTIGVVSTPAIMVRRTADGRAGGALYAVAFTGDPGATGTLQHRLVAIDIATGRIEDSRAIGGSVAGESPDSAGGQVRFDSRQVMQRPALLADAGRQRIYVAFGSHQDIRPWHGWVFGYHADADGHLGTDAPAIWNATPNALGAGIWQSGNGLAQDEANGTVYVMTGNGEANVEPASPETDVSFQTALSNYANMVVGLDPATLRVTEFDMPDDEADRESSDLDLGSSGPVKIPALGVLVGGDKKGELRVLDTAAHLATRQVFPATPPHGGRYYNINGAPVAWQTARGALNLYVWPERDQLRTFRWNPDEAVFECFDSDQSGGACGDAGADASSADKDDNRDPACRIACGNTPGGFLTISSNGRQDETGILWAAMPISEDALFHMVPGVLRAVDADNPDHELWNSGTDDASPSGFFFGKNVPPVVANGRVYLATFGNRQGSAGGVNIYGLPAR